MTVRRSWLIVPAYDSDALTEAGDAKPDVVVLDLQDTVHDHKKHEARSKIRDSISYVRDRGAELFVRVDVDLMYADLCGLLLRAHRPRGPAADTAATGGVSGAVGGSRAAGVCLRYMLVRRYQRRVAVGSP